MKIHGELLALCALHLAGTSAFTVKPPPASASLPSTALHSTLVKNADVLEALPMELIQGGETLRTWPIRPDIDRAQVLLTTDGRPLNAEVQVWQGPDYTPLTMKVYLEDGKKTPFKAILKAKAGGTNTVCVRNKGSYEYPLSAGMEASNDLAAAGENLAALSKPETVQGGGAVKTYVFNPNVASVQCYFETEGRAFKSRIEVLQGPNNKKQEIDLFCSGGNQPFYAVFETPGTGTQIRIVNTNTVEFPFVATVEPYMMETY